MELSIIIPMYKVEKYVEKCILSCCSDNQDIKESEYEIICVNDGSPDNSLSIANKIANKYHNIKVLSQSNGGLSSARNTGMRFAQGKYIWFVDSDDWIEQNCLGKIFNVLNKESPDVLAICNAIFDGTSISRSRIMSDTTQISGSRYMAIGTPHNAQFAIWNQAFLREFNLSFFVGIFHEDSEFTPRAYYLAKSVSRMNDVVYFTRKNPTSITHTVNPKRSFDYVDFVCENLSCFSQKVCASDKYIYHNLISLCLNNALHNILKSSIDERKKLSEDIGNRQHLFVHLKKSTHLKYRIEYYLFRIFPKHTVTLYRLLKMK